MKPQVTRTVTNGVRVTVRRWPDGTTVEATCQCFGYEFRAHDNISCPLYKRQCREARAQKP